MTKMLNLCTIALLFGLVFTGCQKKCDDATALNFDAKEDCMYNTDPTISGFTLNEPVVAGGSFTFSFDLNDAEGLKSWKMEVVRDGVSLVESMDTVTGTSATIDQGVTVPKTWDSGTLFQIVITVTDEHDATSTFSQNLTTQ